MGQCSMHRTFYMHSVISCMAEQNFTVAQKAGHSEITKEVVLWVYLKVNPKGLIAT